MYDQCVGCFSSLNDRVTRPVAQHFSLQRSKVPKFQLFEIGIADEV